MLARVTCGQAASCDRGDRWASEKGGGEHKLCEAEGLSGNNRGVTYCAVRAFRQLEHFRGSMYVRTPLPDGIKAGGSAWSTP